MTITTTPVGTFLITTDSKDICSVIEQFLTSKEILAVSLANKALQSHFDTDFNWKALSNRDHQQTLRDLKKNEFLQDVDKLLTHVTQHIEKSEKRKVILLDTIEKIFKQTIVIRRRLRAIHIRMPSYQSDRNLIMAKLGYDSKLEDTLLEIGNIFEKEIQPRKIKMSLNNLYLDLLSTVDKEKLENEITKTVNDENVVMSWLVNIEQAVSTRMK